MRFQSGRRVVLTHSFVSDEESLDLSSVAVSVWDATGTPVITDAVAVVDGTGWKYSGLTLESGLYRVSWVGSDAGGVAATDTDVFEVVDRFLFSVTEARASDTELTSVDDFPAGEIIHYREVIETEFETITGRSFVPRVTRIRVETDGDDVQWIGKFDCASLVAATDAAGTDWTSSLALDGNGLLSGLSVLAEGTVLSLTVDYGFRSPPADVVRAALIRLRFLLAAESSGVPDRAVSFVSDSGGTFALATPGKGSYRIGIPDVDAVLNLYTYSVFNSVVTVP